MLKKRHPLHEAVADTIQEAIDHEIEIVLDPACGGKQRLPLFVGGHKARDTQMCCVDLLLLSGGRVRCIVEIEESDFKPTKICGKFLQAALADHFIHDTRVDGPVPYGKEVLFIQILDASSCLKSGSRKEKQVSMIDEKIRDLLPLGLSHYSLLLVNGADDQAGLKEVAAVIFDFLAGRRDSAHVDRPRRS